MEQTYETGISHLKGCSMYVSSSEAVMVNRLLKIAEDNPDDVTIIKMPEENDGCIYAKMPFSYLKITGPRHIKLSEEERRIRTERLMRSRYQR